MGRLLRVDAPGAWHHVMNRGAGRRVVFRNDAERRAFLAALALLPERFGVEVHCYCLMGNHFHLLVRSATARLSDAMCWLGAQFTRSVNHERGVDGPIFRGRFHSVLVQREAHLDWLFRYINANPIDLGWIQPLADYRWSGLAVTLGRRAGEPWLSTDYARSRFGNDPHRLELFVERARSPEIPAVLKTYSEADIAAAVETARGPGPNVNTDAQVRAAHTLIAADAGLSNDCISTIDHLEPKQATLYVRRARQRVEEPCDLRELVARAQSVLHVETTESSGAWHRMIPEVGGDSVVRHV